jgi:2,5-furandicarboxylate decarboxylase 1
VSWDPEKFAIRTLVKRLTEMGEVTIHDTPVDLCDISPIVDAKNSAHLFRKAGPEGHEVIAAMSSSRERLAAAFGVPEAKMRDEYLRRSANPQKPFEVPSNEAPVHEVVEEGAAVDLYKMPFHVQHEFDGAPYMTSGIDFVKDPLTGRSNVGARRMMLRGKNKVGINLTAPSDLREIYLGCVARKEKLPISFAVGVHPLYTMAAGSRGLGEEINGLATLRGEPLPVVKCLTNDLLVPADAEMIFEGYLDERGYIDNEGPYGEYMGFYGPMHGDPVFHITCITRRKNVLYQSYKHGLGLKLGECDGAPFGNLQTEARAWEVLKRAGIDVTDVFGVGASGVTHHLRVAIRKRGNADARAAITAVIGSVMNVKHVYVTDHDVDIRSSDQMEWAMSTRFQADRDIMVFPNMREMPMDPSTTQRGIGSKAGFDLTFTLPRSTAVTMRVPVPAQNAGAATHKNVRDALSTGPMHFAKLMRALGSRDGREIVVEIERLRDQGLVERNDDGDYYLKG